MRYKNWKPIIGGQFQSFVICSYIVLVILIFLNEILDLPHIVFGVPSTIINWTEIVIEIVIVFLVSFVSIYMLGLVESKRRQAEECIRHLNSVLKAIRTVNQMISVEKDRDRLLQKTCDVLIETRGYDAAWLGFLRDGKAFEVVVGSGFREDVNRFYEYIIGGKHPQCIKNALVQKDKLIVMYKSRECRDCLFKNACTGKATTIIRLEHANRLFGLLTISLASDIIAADEEKGLLKEVAGDIAIALHNLELEEAHKQAEEQIQKDLKEKEIMLQEIHHRVKNNLQIISSLLNLQSRYIKDEQSLELFRDSQNRVRSMALIHERLYQSRDLASIPFAEYIKKLTSGLYSVYGVDPDRVVLKIETDDVFLGIDQAIPCGLIINELVSNSLKHAFPETWQGKAEIKIALHQIKSEKIELIVSDNGVGIPEKLDFRKTESLGLNLVTLLAEEQLQGKVELDRKEGTRFQIKFMRGK
ncbi:hypothetical protein KAX02_11560 [candidate division WOR-3 bacterium]|nr:hypothetical protein [candidate division WOR-3 bacterium]